MVTASILYTHPGYEVHALTLQGEHNTAQNIKRIRHLLRAAGYKVKASEQPGLTTIIYRGTAAPSADLLKCITQ